MSWVKVDDAFFAHPKFLAVSDAAVALWIRALAWTNLSRTDGVIPRSALPMLSKAKRPEAHARELVSAGLWEDHADGYAVHGFADYQATRAEREDATRAKTERQRRWREGASTSSPERRSVDASTERLRDAAPHPHPHPTPHPHPKKQESAARGTGLEAEAIAAELARHPRTAELGRDLAFAETLLGRAMGAGRKLEWVLAAIAEAAADTPDGDPVEKTQKRVRAYCDRAAAPRVAQVKGQHLVQPSTERAWAPTFATAPEDP